MTVLLNHFTLCFLYVGNLFLKKHSIQNRYCNAVLDWRTNECSEGVKKFSLFPNFSLCGLFQARRTEVTMNLSDFWLRVELPVFLQLAERFHFKELLCLFLRIISFNLCIQKYASNDETQRNKEVGVNAE